MFTFKDVSYFKIQTLSFIQNAFRKKSRKDYYPRTDSFFCNSKLERDDNDATDCIKVSNELSTEFYESGRKQARCCRFGQEKPTSELQKLRQSNQ